MKRNNNKFFFSLKYLFTSLVLLAMVFTFVLFPSKTGRLNNLAGESAVSGDVLSYDYVLVIDESGSMKRNDSANMRIDAAKLFVYLAETMNPGSRVLVSGFGETLNIYQQMAGISGNEKSISAAISKIKSDQDITDMKGALAKIKLMLDAREKKNKTVLIFLTDGSLTVDDIPAPTQDEQKPPRETTAETTAQDNPGRPVKNKQIKQGSSLISKNSKGADANNYIDDPNHAGSSKDPEYIADLENLDTASSAKDYLENYKKELIDLCYKYSNDGITIYPIAFTQEADISLLEQM
ncbi:MAG TPA: VWA domain-containing protein, partial [Candidatus Humimicrobiaceae bacterium]